jgi:hypothetical protein
MDCMEAVPVSLRALNLKKSAASQGDITVYLAEAG